MDSEKPGKKTEKPKLAVFKFSSCDGCQLQLLNLEDELLNLVDAIEIAYFLEARRRVLPPPYDVGLVEGSISTPEEAERIQEVRRNCRYLIAIGACATSGGIQALRNWANVDEFKDVVYPRPDYIAALETATPIASHVFVDFELRGCPVSPQQLLELVSALLVSRKPNIPTYSVCVECKRRGLPCVLVSKGEQCLGPITQAGCGRAVSRLWPSVLRMFWTNGTTQHAGAGPLVYRSIPDDTRRHETNAAIVQWLPGALQASR